MTASVVTVIERAKIEQINREHGLCAGAYGTAIVHAINCGRMLAAVKADLSHGDWLPWVEQHFDGSERTARVYMQLAAAPAITDRQSAADLPASMSAALKEITKPKPRAPSPRDAIGMVGALEDDDTPNPNDAQFPARLDQAQGGTERVWTDQHSRRRNRIIDMLDEARSQLDHASDDGLNPHARAEMLRTAAIKARQAEGQLGELAFTFER